MGRDLTMQLRTRIEGGGTRLLDACGVDSEYGTLRDVLIGPIDHFTWQPGNAVCQRAQRVGLKFDFAVARRQYDEMIAAYRQRRCHANGQQCRGSGEGACWCPPRAKIS